MIRYIIDDPAQAGLMLKSVIGYNGDAHNNVLWHAQVSMIECRKCSWIFIYMEYGSSV